MDEVAMDRLIYSLFARFGWQWLVSKQTDGQPTGGCFAFVEKKIF